MNCYNEKYLKTQSEIMKDWHKPDHIVVSVLCGTYNHEDYIERTIVGFLNQETNFAFEIIIHDDASTDKSQAIIKQYQTLYPKIIKPILQEHNQYSQGLMPFPIMSKKATGKYIAICEGDDYWNDKLKLRKQVNAFIENPDISLCFHPATKFNVSTEQKSIVSQHYSQDSSITIKDVILGGGHFMPTASLMFVNESIETLCNSYKEAPIGDYFIQMFMANLRGAYYINTPMSIYRQNTPNSWSANLHSTKVQKIKHKLSMLKPIDRFYPYLKNSTCKKLLEDVLITYFIDAMKIPTGKKDGFQKYIRFLLTIMALKNLSKLRITSIATYKIVSNLLKKQRD